MITSFIIPDNDDCEPHRRGRGHRHGIAGGAIKNGGALEDPAIPARALLPKHKGRPHGNCVGASIHWTGRARGDEPADGRQFIQRSPSIISAPSLRRLAILRPRGILPAAAQRKDEIHASASGVKQRGGASQILNEVAMPQIPQTFAAANYASTNRTWPVINPSTDRSNALPTNSPGTG